jgi:hypothetical protein
LFFAETTYIEQHQDCFDDHRQLSLRLWTYNVLCYNNDFSAAPSGIFGVIDAENKASKIKKKHFDELKEEAN